MAVVVLIKGVIPTSIIILGVKEPAVQVQKLVHCVHCSGDFGFCHVDECMGIFVR